MADVQLDDLLIRYPDQDEPKIQTWITGLEEFNSLGSETKEPIPEKGEGFKHQKLIARFLLEYDFLYAYNETGTGKTLTAIQTAETLKSRSMYDMKVIAELDSDERAQIKEVANIGNLLLSSPKTNIMRVVVIVKGPTLEKQFKQEIICKYPKGNYYTQEIKEAESSSALTRRVKKSLDGYYEFWHYETFASHVSNKNPAQIEKAFSDTLFVIDEIQNLRNNINKDEKKIGKREQQYRFKYQQIQRALKYGKRNKVLLLSATPMVNETSELPLIMNLLYPEGHPDMPLGVDYSDANWDLSKIEPYLRGRISYVRQLDTGAIPTYKGTQLPGYFEVVAMAPMSKFQAGVIRNIGTDSFYSKSRAASIFVFPDGGSSAESLKKYIKGANPDSVVKSDGPYIPTKELLEYISRREPLDGSGEEGKNKYLGYLSRKFQDIIDNCNEATRQSCFVFTDYVAAAGAISLGMCFEAQGYERFMSGNNVFKNVRGVRGTEGSNYCEPDDISEKQINNRLLKKGLRYAMITGNTTSQKVVNNILRVFNSYENRHGEYIKVLIGSSTIREGLNLSNVQNIQLTGGGWNQAVTYQAISRGIRSTSHVYLINEIQDIIIQISLGYLIGTIYDLLRGVSDEFNGPEIRDLINETVSLQNSKNKSKKVPEKNKFRKEIKENMRKIVRLINEIPESIMSAKLKLEWYGNADFLRSFREATPENVLDIAQKTVKILRLLAAFTGIPGETSWQKEADKLNGKANNLSTSISVKNNLLINRNNNAVKDILNTLDMPIRAFLEALDTRDIQNNQESYTRIMTILDGYQSPDDATISIDVYKHASVYNIPKPNAGENGGPNIDIGTAGNLGEALNTIDITFYTKSEDKDRKNKKVERYLKQCAVDGQIHVRRNIRDSERFNGTPRCDYENCNYEFVDPAPIMIYRFDGKFWRRVYQCGFIDDGNIIVYDGLAWHQLTLEDISASEGNKKDIDIYESSSFAEMKALEKEKDISEGDLLIGSGELATDSNNYDTLYALQDSANVALINTAIYDNFLINPQLTYKQLFNSGSGKKSRFILESLINLIDGQKTIRNRFGQNNFINEQQGTIFLQQNFPENPFYSETSLGNSYYANNLQLVNNTNLRDILVVEKIGGGNIIEELSAIPKNKRFDKFLNDIDINNRVKALEQSIEVLFAREIEGEKISPDFVKTAGLVAEKYGNSIFQFQQPLQAINANRNNVTGLGAPKKKASEKTTKETIKRFDYTDYGGYTWANYMNINKIKGRRGAKFYLALNDTFNVLYHECEPLSSDADKCEPGSQTEIEQEEEGAIVIIHMLYMMDPATHSNATSFQRYKRGYGRLRIYNTQTRIWSEVDERDLQVYSATLQLAINMRFEKFNNMAIYGVITPDMTNKKKRLFRIAQNEDPGKNIFQDVKAQVIGSKSKDIIVELALKMIAEGIIDEESLKPILGKSDKQKKNIEKRPKKLPKMFGWEEYIDLQRYLLHKMYTSKITKVQLIKILENELVRTGNYTEIQTKNLFQ